MYVYIAPSRILLNTHSYLQMVLLAKKKTFFFSILTFHRFTIKKLWSLLNMFFFKHLFHTDKRAMRTRCAIAFCCSTLIYFLSLWRTACDPNDLSMNILERIKAPLVVVVVFLEASIALKHTHTHATPETSSIILIIARKKSHSTKSILRTIFLFSLLSLTTCSTSIWCVE